MGSFNRLAHEACITEQAKLDRLRLEVSCGDDQYHANLAMIASAVSTGQITRAQGRVMVASLKTPEEKAQDRRMEWRSNPALRLVSAAPRITRRKGK